MLLQPVLFVILYMAKTQFPLKQVRDYAKARFKALVWNGVINFYYEMHLVLSTIGWLSLKDLRFGSQYTGSENFSSAFGVVLALFSIIFPFGLHNLFSRKLKKAKTEK